MKKLLFSIVPLMISSSVFAELSFDDAYWIIKDGKLTDNVEVWDYDPEKLEDKIPNVIADTTVNGENVVVYKQISQDFLQGMGRAYMWRSRSFQSIPHDCFLCSFHI